jgi:hypothetical protein
MTVNHKGVQFSSAQYSEAERSTVAWIGLDCKCSHQTPSVARTRQSSGKRLSAESLRGRAELPSLDVRPLPPLEGDLSQSSVKAEGAALCSASGMSFVLTAPSTDRRLMHCTSGKCVTPNREKGSCKI